VHGRPAGRGAACLRYPSPSTCGAAGRHTDRPDGIVGDDTPWARSFAPFARPKGLCAPMRGAPLKRWLLFPCAAAQPVFCRSSSGIQVCREVLIG
jgi:hypothetical protein